jgi:hypothetical protein
VAQPGERAGADQGAKVAGVAAQRRVEGSLRARVEARIAGLTRAGEISRAQPGVGAGVVRRGAHGALEVSDRVAGGGAGVGGDTKRRRSASVYGHQHGKESREHRERSEEAEEMWWGESHRKRSSKD